jgi:tRNA modification GTPase
MTSPQPDAETYAACLTPPGTGAIATLAVRGPRAWPVARELFRFAAPQRELPAEPVPGKVWLGRMGASRQSAAADEVVLAVKRPGPGAWLEIHCHGGREVVRLLLEACAADGIQTCSWQELERLTGGDPARTAALEALVEARTPRTAAILLDQYHGALARAVDEVRAALEGGRFLDAEASLRDLTRWAPLGRRLIQPWRVVIAGAPNVGKSSLVNALAGYRRSVVTATPGTTRDVVTTLVALEGWLVELADTAGLRAEAGELERMGMERAQTAAAQADLCLWVLDGAAPPVWPMLDVRDLRLVINKADLSPAWDFSRAGGAVTVSARSGAGIEQLSQSLARWLVPDVPAPGAAVPFTPAICGRLEEVQRQLSAGQTGDARHALEEVWGAGERGALAL